MPRRVLASATPGRASSNVSFLDPPSADDTYLDNLSTLRKQWKWAAFSQFFYTFAPLLAAPDVALTDIEDDLARGTALYLPRIMHRLLYTLTQDRKLSLENWQSSLRKQYLRRDPDANPLGPEPPAPSRMQSRDPTTPFEDEADENIAESEAHPQETTHLSTTEPEGDTAKDAPDSADGKAESSEPVEMAGVKEEEVENSKASVKDEDEVREEKQAAEDIQPEESRNWLDLSMIEKLDTLYTVQEWQFQNPHRLRQIMKDDGDHGLWRHEPLGFDAKSNHYWLIGPDRLWIQREPPRPPAPPKRKRKPAPSKSANKAASKASTSKAALQEDSDSAPEPDPVPQKRSRTAGGRTTRQQAKEVESPSGRGARAAKLQANKKLDAQAKELAEFQRQAAASERVSSRSTRNTRSNGVAQPSPRPVRGTRASARLRGTPMEDDDDEWQQVPDEWLQEGADEAPTRNGRAKRATRSQVKAARPSRRPRSEDEADDEDAPHTGLSDDDAVSELTELSDDESERVQSTDAKSTTKADASIAEAPAVEEPQAEKSEEKPAVPEDNTGTSGNTTSHIPPGFVEWELICVTLPEWEEIGERFAKATYYSEKRLHKQLSAIVPEIVAELKEVERKRKLEEAIVHRKRSSRIAIKETEKEEARLAAARKAEEEEKLSRQRRFEARSKKEDAEREKRETAREQRRIEREERERRAQERRDRDSVQASTPTASVVSTSRQPTRTATPNVGETWTLDCEICGRCGVNMDDGLPMVSCGMCSRWQHIPCHDAADDKAGVARRNWKHEKFFCSRCKPVALQRQANGTARTTPAAPHRTPSRAQKSPAQAVPYNAYPQAASSPLYPHPQQSAYSNGMSYGQQYSDQRAMPSASSPYAQQRTQGGISFSHYQPQQHAFSRGGWPNGYQGNLAGGSMNQYATSYPQNGSYGAGAQYQYHAPTAQAHSYSRTDVPDTTRPLDAQSMHTMGWAGSGDNRHTSSQISQSHLSAAESLAYMQGGSAPRTAAWSNGASYPQHAVSPSTSAAPNSHMGNGGYHFPSS
ncbi:hypothetical protein PsYK624_017540 [Phanerochaete sordida]|uniref:Zinc finger PHD-type domain-containing protein n=1 Tax=Phanerochaete sordida TaxID=48140 RepID=A0A9P3L839_9APHY|nr:hypothetical protein PsYK624_017540 [Phanerochaete sordida]